MTPAELKQARSTLGLTQTQMAARVGMKLRGYQRLEGEERGISETVALLVQALLEKEAKMDSVIRMRQSTLSCVARVSVQVSEYSAENGGRDAGEATLYAVEVLFPDGTWVVEDYHRDTTLARSHQLALAHARGADVLSESIWPNRQVR